MRKFLLFIVVILVFRAHSLTAQSKAPQGDREFEIAEIVVEGVKYLDHNAIISISGLNVGDKINLQGEDLPNAMKKLWKQSLLSDVKIIADRFDGPKVYLILQLTERPRLTKIEFEGVKKSQITEIEDKIDLIRGRILTDALVKNTELAVKKYYIEKGFYDVEIKTRQIPDTISTNGAKLKIIVDKKQKVKIQDVQFVGNDNFSDLRLRMKMKNTSRKLRFTLVNDLVSRLIYSKPKDYANFFFKQQEREFSDLFEYVTEHANLNFFKTSKLIRKDYKEDHAGLVAFYNARGYRDMEVVGDSIFRNPNGTLTVKVKIDEGNKYHFRDIIWSGNYVHNDETLDQILGIEKGDVYNIETINKRINFNPTGGMDVSALYMDNGYLFFNIEPVELRVDKDSIDIEMRISEGPQATLKRVSISGNTRTNDHVVLRELRTIPGEKFSREKIIRTQRELSQLGYFNPETVNPNVVPNMADGTADVEWQLEEISNDQIQLSGGWGGFIGFIGTVGITFNNFSARNLFKPKNWDPLPVGDGQTFGISVQANGRRFQSYSASFTEPWLGGKKPNALSFGLNRSVQRNIDFFSNQEFGSFKVSRASLSLTRRLNWPDNWFMLTNSLQYFLYELNNFGLNLGCETCNSNSVLLNTVIARNSVDNPIFPRTGSNISLSISATPPYSYLNGKSYERISSAERYKWMEYHKWMFDASFFTPIMDKLVINARAHFGLLGGYNPEVGIAPFERFYLGGDGITGQMFLLGTDIIGLRGYPNNQVVPTPETIISYEQIPGDGGVDAVTRTIAGGTIYNKFIMEARFLVSPNPSATIFLLTFAEAGNTWNDPKKYNPYDLKRSAGVGARIFMPAFGTIGVDWGYGFDNIPGQTGRSGGQIHFMIGQQFR